MHVSADTLERWHAVVLHAAEYYGDEFFDSLLGELFDAYIARQEWERQHLCPKCGSEIRVLPFQIEVAGQWTTALGPQCPKGCPEAEQMAIPRTA